MTLRRALIRSLDRPGGRVALGAMVGHVARKWAPGVRVYYRQGMWVHQHNDVIFVDSPILDYRASIFGTWADELDRCMADATDHWFYVYQPHPGDVILDVGAGKGEDTVVFSKAVGPLGRVIAIEAHPITFRCLRLFCDLNHLRNVETLHFAIVDRDGPVGIDTKKEWQANRIGTGAEQYPTLVPGTTLDEIAERAHLKRIDFLKINIEGAEIKAIQGMGSTLQVTRSLCISCHDFRSNSGEGEFFRTKTAIQDAIERAGLRIVSRDADQRPYVADQVNGVRD
jgi:FkbM family methyltransferase